MMDLLTTIVLSPGGSSTVHIYTQTIHRTTQKTTNLEECEPCPVFASFTVAFSLQPKKKHGKTSVRVQCTYYQNTHTLQNSHIHTPTHYKTHTHTHTHTHTYPHPHITKPIHTDTHTLQNPHIHTHPHTPTHYKTHTYRHTHITKLTHTHTHIHTHTHTHTLTLQHNIKPPTK